MITRSKSYKKETDVAETLVCLSKNRLEILKFATFFDFQQSVILPEKKLIFPSLFIKNKQ